MLHKKRDITSHKKHKEPESNTEEDGKVEDMLTASLQEVILMLVNHASDSMTAASSYSEKLCTPTQALCELSGGLDTR